MGIMMSKDLRDSDELSRRISADLRERAQASKDEDPDEADKGNFSDDIDKIPETKKTGRFAWLWLVLFIAAIISVILIFMI